MCIKRINLVSILSTLLDTDTRKIEPIISAITVMWVLEKKEVISTAVRSQLGSRSLQRCLYCDFYKGRLIRTDCCLSSACDLHVEITFCLENFYDIKGRATEKKGGLWRGLGKRYKLSKALHCIPQAHPSVEIAFNCRRPAIQGTPTGPRQVSFE